MTLPMRSIVLSALAAALVFPLVGRAAAPDDAAFVAKAASGGMMEVELGSYAEKNASDPKVKAFGRHMVVDHGKANAALETVAGSAGIPVPTAMNAEHRKTVDELTALKGAEFDRRYVDLMVEDHEKDVAAFREQAESGDSPIDQWARETVPTLENHLEMIRGIANGQAASPASY
jgi:putative membrane protein